MKPDIRKIVQVVNWFASQSPFKEAGKLHLLKYVYFADRYHLRKYGRLVTGDTYYAMRYGPVASATKEVIEFRIKDCAVYAGQYIRLVDPNTVCSVAPVDSGVFSDTDLEAMRSAKALSARTGDIVAYTHLFPEWKRHEASLKGNGRRVRMDMLDFFGDAPADAEYCVVEPGLLALNRELFFEDLAVFGR